MAQMSSGILGNLRGKVGDKIYFVRKGKQCVRSVPKQRSNEPSKAQLEQRAKMSKAIHFVKSLRQLLLIGYRLYFKHHTPYNEIVKQTLRHAITGAYPDFTIDYSKVKVCQGKLMSESAKPRSAARENIKFIWKGTEFEGIDRNDKSILVAYCEALNQCTFTTASL
jgi:hypothetical protein